MDRDDEERMEDAVTDGGHGRLSRWRARAGEDVRQSLDRAGRLLAALEAGLDGASGQVAQAHHRIRTLEERVQHLEEASHVAGARLAEAEEGASRLLGLYTATYRLHSSLDPDHVLGTLAEIALNLVGAHSFGVLLVEDGGAVEIALAEGMPRAFAHQLSEGRYLGGDPVVDACLSGAGLVLEAAPGAATIAGVPLALCGRVAGVLAIWRLLDHRPPLGDDDRELFELLSAHAAMALHAARAWSRTGSAVHAR